MTETQLGGSPLVTFEWADFNIFKEKFINKITNDYRPNEIQSNIATTIKHNLWESNFDYLNDEIFFPLKLWLIETSQIYINQKTNKNYRFVITESWAHVTDFGGYHAPHYHSHSTWSGVFYLTTTYTGANTWYMSYTEPKPGLEFLIDTYSICPKEGMLALFPSHILHDAQPFQEKNSPRIILSFNAVCL